MPADDSGPKAESVFVSVNMPCMRPSEAPSTNSVATNFFGMPASDCTGLKEPSAAPPNSTADEKWSSRGNEASRKASTSTWRSVSET